MDKLNVLIVEDEKITQDVLATTLRDNGFEVFTASDGEDGLQQALDKKPDITLLDIFMPNMGGIDMLKKLRQDAWGKTALVVMLTNANDPKNVADAVNQGVYEFLVKKDWKLDDIANRIKTLVKEEQKQ